MLRNLCRSAIHLFFPRTCPVCGRILTEGEHLLCTACRWEIPLTRFWEDPGNPVKVKMSAIVPVENAFSFYYYRKNSNFADLIHRFKYHGDSRLPYSFGVWFGEELAEAGALDVDVIVPVLLHPFRRMKRGYNQAEMLARGLGRSMHLLVSARNLIRKTHNSSQTRQSRKERWENVSGIFRVRRPERWEGMHILLVDDVLTTGATVAACAEAILGSVSGCRVSVATLATTTEDPLGQ